MLASATLFVVGGLIVGLTHNWLSTARDAELKGAASSFQNGPATRMRTPDDLVTETRRWLQSGVFPAEEAVAVRTSSGLVLSNDSQLDLRKLAVGRELLQATTPRWWDLPGSHAEVRALTVPIILGGRQIGTFVCAASEDRIDVVMAGLLVRIGLASVVGLALAALLGFVSIRRALRSLDRMTADVHAIEQTGDMSKRVTRDGPADEVGRLGAAFDRMLDRLQGVLDSKRRFLSDASHELRTPLTVARGQLELLDDAVQDPGAHRSLGLAVQELDRMRKMVEDLLLLARLDEGLSPTLRPVELDLVLSEAALRAMLLGRRRVAVDAKPELFAMADQEALLRVITNLVNNAVEHAGPEATISLTAVRRGGEAVVGVADNGPGIPAEDLPHVFDRLFRGSGVARSSPGGVGLGLPIARSLIQAMNGRIDVETSSAGTRFTVRLPPAEPTHHLAHDGVRSSEGAHSAETSMARSKARND